MDIESLRQYCLSKKGVTEGFPFDDVTLVFKVGGKMFTLASLDETPLRVALKCDPDRAIQLRDTYPESIFPGWHLNKKHWNTLIFEGALSPSLLIELIDHSYDLVVSGLPKKEQQKLGL